jgi:hypothetical protein
MRHMLRESRTREELMERYPQPTLAGRLQLAEGMAREGLVTADDMRGIVTNMPLEPGITYTVSTLSDLVRLARERQEILDVGSRLMRKAWSQERIATIFGGPSLAAALTGSETAPIGDRTRS